MLILHLDANAPSTKDGAANDRHYPLPKSVSSNHEEQRLTWTEGYVVHPNLEHVRCQKQERLLARRIMWGRSNSRKTGLSCDVGLLCLRCRPSTASTPTEAKCGG